MSTSRFLFALPVMVFLINGALARAESDFTLDSARQAATNSGDPKALYFLAKAYAKGNGVPQDAAKAADYLRESAEKGYAYAQNDFGTFYAKGFGVKQDYSEAAWWYRKAAENGDPLGQYSMGMICFQGRGIPKDIQQGLSWYHKSADQGQPDAILALGSIYLTGSEQVPLDTQEAFKWFSKPEIANRPEAINSLGFIYEHGGVGLKPDIAKAVPLYLKAAEQKLGKAQTNLGRMYQTGTGVEKDLVEAYKWFLLGSQNGDGVANHYLLEMEGDNSLGKPFIAPEQIATARRLAHDWSKAHQEPADAKQ